MTKMSSEISDLRTQIQRLESQKEGWKLKLGEVSDMYIKQMREIKSEFQDYKVQVQSEQL